MLTFPRKHDRGYEDERELIATAEGEHGFDASHDVHRNLKMIMFRLNSRVTEIDT